MVPIIPALYVAYGMERIPDPTVAVSNVKTEDRTDPGGILMVEVTLSKKAEGELDELRLCVCWSSLKSPVMVVRYCLAGYRKC
mmetsp:Transcript_7704/g.10809  ORF Transcript_7704/g.10809 Transcript_7704/m.10809 type:complete len:83 (+) Transcript_7704:893-1141(+)